VLRCAAFEVYRAEVCSICVCAQVARIQQQVLDALKQAPQSNPAVQDAIARLNSQLFDISMVRLSHQCRVEWRIWLWYRVGSIYIIDIYGIYIWYFRQIFSIFSYFQFLSSFLYFCNV